MLGHGHDHSSPKTTVGVSVPELHAHKAGDSHHSHAKDITSQKVLTIALCITLFFSGVEFFAGILAHSLALISDAGHMLTDAAGLFLAVIAQYISKRPPSSRYSFGYGRAEGLAAFLNGVSISALIVWISYESVQRLIAPREVHGEAVTLMALLGVVVNLVVAWLLSRNNNSLNTRAAMIHVMGDLLASIAALIAGLVIQYTGWMQIDPILSLVVCCLLIRSTISILGDAYHFLMKGVPDGIDYIKVGHDLKNIPGVSAVHDLHVWEMTPGFPDLIGHIEVDTFENWSQTMDAIRKMLLDHHGIDHVTLQPELAHAHEHEHDDHAHDHPNLATGHSA
jgi:cobalt-zinc-cadmium efflux system protein